jgi:hypothetical protein
VLVMEVAQVGVVSKMGDQVWVFKLGCSSRGAPVRRCTSGVVNTLFSIFRWMTVEDDLDNSPLEEQIFWCNSSSTTLYRFFLISLPNTSR